MRNATRIVKRLSLLSSRQNGDCGTEPKLTPSRGRFSFQLSFIVTPTWPTTDSLTDFTPTLFLYEKIGIHRIARWAIWSSKLLLGFRRLRTAEDLDRRWLRTIPDRVRVQDIALRPPRRLVCDFPFHGTVTHSLKLFEPLE